MTSLPSQQKEKWDVEGSILYWYLHDDECAVYLCNPRKHHENGLCDHKCTCGRQEQIDGLVEETRQAERERVRALVRKMDINAIYHCSKCRDSLLAALDSESGGVGDNSLA